MRTTPASPGRMLLRGAAKRCAVCGGGRLFSAWCRMADRCRTCGYRFEREEGFFLGASVINLVIAQGVVMLVPVIPTIILLNANANAGLRPAVLGGFVGAVLAPVLFSPWAKTRWVAIELTVRPVDPTEPWDAVA